MSQKLTKISQGLKLNRIGILLAVVGTLGSGVFPPLLMVGMLSLVACLGGQLLCLATPVGMGMVGASLAAGILGLVVMFSGAAVMPILLKVFGGWGLMGLMLANMAGQLLSALSPLFMAVFMMQLATWLERPDLRSQAVHLILAPPLAVAVYLGAMMAGGEQVIGVVIFAVLILATAVGYFGLLGRVATAVDGRAAKSE